MKVKIISFLILVCFFSGCGLSIPGGATPTQSYICQVSTNSFFSCCGGNGGPQTCSPPTGGHYFRSGDGALVCGDGSVSSSCFR